MLVLRLVGLVASEDRNRASGLEGGHGQTSRARGDETRKKVS